MGKKLFVFLSFGILLLSLTACSEQELDGSNVIIDNYECCAGCLCGDTMELLKNTETAWDLTEINLKGEYVYVRHSFINFHGTGKNKFVFFKNDKNGATISEVRGEVTFNDQNEIILVPNNSKNSKITCKIGEEKDLIAVIHCDNNFGTFTLQKEGILDLPTVIKDNVAETKTVVIKTNDNKKITIKEENEINVLLSVIDNSKVWTGAITTPSPLYEMELFGSNNQIIAKILYNPGHYFSIEINNRSYSLINIDKSLLNTILSK